jgi:hypothetical protein
MEAIRINPAEEFVVEAPVAGKTNKFLKYLIFKKSPKFGWTKEKVKEFITSKIRKRKPVISETDNEIVACISDLKAVKKHRVPFHEEMGISAIVGEAEEVLTDEEVMDVSEISEDVGAGRKPKITRAVTEKVQSLYKQGKTPKEINVVLETNFGIKLHPSTINKIVRGTYIRQSIDEEVTMTENPLITEILENPSIIEQALENKAVPLTMTNWFQTRLKELAARELTAKQIADEMNKELLQYIPDEFWKRMSKVIVGKKGSLGKARVGKVITPAMVRRVAHKVVPEPWKMIDIERWKRFAGAKGKGILAELGRIAQTGDKRALYEALKTRIAKIKPLRKYKAFQSPEAQQLLATWSPGSTGAARESRRAQRLKALAKARATKAAKVAAKGGPKKPRKKKGTAVSAEDVLDVIGSLVSVEDVASSLSPLELESLTDEMMEVMVNPMFRGKSLKNAFAKLGYQLPGVFAGAWALKLTNIATDFVTGLIPAGPVKSALQAVIPSGVVWLLAEAILPEQFAITANSVQTLALYNAANRILKFGNFELVPSLVKPATTPVKEEVKEKVSEEEEESEVEEVEISDELYEAWRRGELTDEEVAQMIYTGKYSPSGVEPTAESTEQEETEQVIRAEEMEQEPEEFSVVSEEEEY